MYAETVSAFVNSGGDSAPAAHGLQGLPGFFVAQGLHGLRVFLTAQGLHGLQFFVAAHGLQGLQTFFVAQGLHGLEAFLTAQGFRPRFVLTRRGTTHCVATPTALHGLEKLLVFLTAHGLQMLLVFLTAHGLALSLLAAMRIGWLARQACTILPG
ncbi:MAG: hypothetical protein JKY04_00505 [Sneathiella sp.]|nr:hypothetical protein [Sneathiella sp.]